MYGENNAEVHNNIDEPQTPLMDPKHYSSESENDKIFLGGYEIDQFQEYNLKKKDLSIYIPYERSVYEEKIKVHFMSYYKKWSPMKIIIMSKIFAISILIQMEGVRGLIQNLLA